MNEPESLDPMVTNTSPANDFDSDPVNFGVSEVPLIYPPAPDAVGRTRRTVSRNRINPDARWMLFFAIGLVGLLMVSSFMTSFSGIYSIAAYTGLPSYLYWLPALFIDAAILAYTVSLFIFKARGESTWKTISALAGFASLSIAANIAHTVSFWDGDLSDYRAWIGVAITAAAPIAVLLASEEIARLAFESPEKS